MLHLASHRLAASTLVDRYGADAMILDVTSHGLEPWVRFSPFFPHGNIPVPFSPEITAMSVEGIWQALKVFERADIDPSKLTITTMRGIKRSVRTLGAVLGHRAGLHSERLLSYIEARHQIYLPAYRWVLDHCLQTELDELRRMNAERSVVLLDYETNADIEDVTRPLSHAALIVRYVAGNYG